VSESEPNRMIVVDGVDGAGKGVQTRRLIRSLENAGLPVILTREPGGSPAAEEIRELLVNGDPEKWDDMTELLLMYAARRAHMRDTVWPALAAGKWVVSDRHADSSRAFQGIAGELGLELVEALHSLVLGDFQPELVIILDLSESTALERTRNRGGGEDRFERKGEAYHARVRNAFLEIAARDSRRYQVIDAGKSMDRVSEDIVARVNRHFGLELSAVRDID
jgi:dTMP kinase